MINREMPARCGSVAALNAIIENGLDEKLDSKKKVIAVLDKVSEQLGNTRTVCKKYYVHPSLLELYENGKLDKLLSKKDNAAKPDNGLSPVEKKLVSILESL